MKAIVLSLFVSILLFAQNKLVIKTTKLTDNLYMIKGTGGNIALSVGDDGLFMIDAQFAKNTEKIMEAVRKISDKKIKFLVNTHWHGDHTGGNENFSKDGAIIVSHENVRKRMSTEQFNKMWKRKTPPSPKMALPTVTFTKDLKFFINGDEVEVSYIDPAHTDGDAIIYFKKQNVLHMGDLYFVNMYPFFDQSSGGRIQGFIAALETVLKKIDDNTRIIPGHGKLSNKQELAMHLEMTKTITARVEKAMKEKKSLEDIQSMNLTKDFDKQYEKGFIKSKSMILLIYNSLEAEMTSR